MLSKLMKKRLKQNTESIIAPNVDLAIDSISDYRTVLKNDPDIGYKGLKQAFESKTQVRLTIENKDNETSVIEGTISHFDDSFGQLVIISGNTLKRFVFDQILDVQFLNEDV